MILVVLPIIQDVTFVQLFLGITSCHCGKYENLHELQRKVVGNATEKVTISLGKSNEIHKSYLNHQIYSIFTLSDNYCMEIGLLYYFQLGSILFP